MKAATRRKRRKSVQNLFNPSISVEEVERRILRACKTIRALPDREKKFLTSGHKSEGWPEIVQDSMDAYNSVEEHIKFRPTPFDVSDMLTALSWLNILSNNEYKYIWWRSFDLSFKFISMRTGRSYETARKRYRDAILQVWHEANTQVIRDLV